MTPAKAPNAAAKVKANEDIVLILTPIKLAARGFFSLARSAEPMNVFSKNQ